MTHRQRGRPGDRSGAPARGRTGTFRPVPRSGERAQRLGEGAGEGLSPPLQVLSNSLSARRPAPARGLRRVNSHAKDPSKGVVKERRRKPGPRPTDRLHPIVNSKRVTTEIETPTWGSVVYVLRDSGCTGGGRPNGKPMKLKEEFTKDTTRL